jgi:hypothetical protein
VVPYCPHSGISQNYPIMAIYNGHHVRGITHRRCLCSCVVEDEHIATSGVMLIHVYCDTTLIPNYSTLKLEAAGSSEILVPTYQIRGHAVA